MPSRYVVLVLRELARLPSFEEIMVNRGRNVDTDYTLSR